MTDTPPPADDWEAALEAAMAGPEPDTTTEPAAPEDTDTANRWLGALGATRRRRGEFEAALQAQRDRLAFYAAKELARFEEKEAWLVASLALYHAAILEREPKRVTIPLPNGRLTSKGGQPTFEVTDLESLVVWLEESGLAESVVEYPPTPDPKVKKVPLRQVLEGFRISDGVPVTEDGEVVPGVAVTPAGRSFTPKP